MRRKFLLGSILVLGTSTLAILVVFWYAASPDSADLTDRDIEAARIKTQRGGPSLAQVQAPIGPNQSVRLAIGGLGLADETEDRQLAELLTASLTGTRGLELVERQAMDKVLHELQISLSGLVRATNAVRAGRLLRADWFLLGSPAKLSGTNSITVRIVDARNGILRDGEVFRQEPAMPEFAAKLASFVRACRPNAGQSRPRLYLAIGAFEDLSINNRHADFSRQLRGFLTAAYQHGKVTLLEREHVADLLHEARLDLAGLTSESQSAPPAPMQSAYWLVDGCYLSTENQARELELEVDVRRLFGRLNHLEFRERPGDPLFQKVKSAIDRAMAESSISVIPTRDGEIRSQMGAGKEIARLPGFGLVSAPFLEILTPEETRRRQRNLEEAVRAFETVLLLDPENREAKIYLAAVLRRDPLRRMEEARDYYRQLIEATVQDRWTGTARQALLASFLGESPATRARWFAVAAQATSNSNLLAFYRQNADQANSQALLKDQTNPKSRVLAETTLATDLDEWDKNLRTRNWSPGAYLVPLEKFAGTFGTNHAAAAQRLAELLPSLAQRHPDLAPHLLAGAISHVVQTNSPLIGQFTRSLDEAASHLDALFKPDHYFALVSGSALSWSMDWRLFGLVLKILDATQLAAARGYAEKTNDEQRMARAFACMGLERWQEALQIFESYTNTPVYMANRGLWGRGFYPVLPSKQANRCREKLELPGMKDPREFDFGKSALCLHGPGVDYTSYLVTALGFAADSDGLWIYGDNTLIHLDFELRTNQVLSIPDGAFPAITCVCFGADKLWTGTSGAGLLEYDRITRKWRRWVEADGLLMNHIGCLCLAGGQLWIGYNQATSPGLDQTGGLGMLDLRTGRIKSFTPSLKRASVSGRNFPRNAIEEPLSEPTLLPVVAISQGAPGEIWFVTRYGSWSNLRRYRVREETWDGGHQDGLCSSVLSDGRRLFVGRYSFGLETAKQTPSGLGLAVRNLEDGKWLNLSSIAGFPPDRVSTLALDGKSLWIGGLGYVALLDPDQPEVRRYAYVLAKAVDRIEIAGGFVWAQFDRHLFRAPLQRAY